MRLIKAIIVDDEKLSRDYVLKLLSDYENIQVLDLCTNGREALNGIILYNPDLVFIDIQIPHLNGFKVISEAKSQGINPLYVLTTASEQFAVKAFEINAADYLLKPFTPERFDNTMKKVIDRIEQNYQSKVTEVLESLVKLYSNANQKQGVSYPERILVKVNSRLFFVNTSDIYWLEGSGDYVKIHLENVTYMINDSLTNLENTLNPKTFVRVHRSSIVNVNQISEFKGWTNSEYILILKNNQEVKLSRTYKEKINVLFNKDYWT
jgi:two-component system, LytTR family, response regulator